MTRGEIVFELSRTLGMDDTEGSDELLLMQRWVNRAIKDVLVKTRCRLDEGDMTLSGGGSDWRVDDALLATDLMHIAADNYPQRLTAITNDRATDLLAAAAPVDTSQGIVPLYYYARGNFFRIVPVPSDGTKIRVVYVPKPTEIPADGTTNADSADLADPTYGGIPEEYHDAVFMYCLWLAAQYDDKGGGFYRGHAFAAGVAYQNNYEDRIKQIRRELRGKTARGMHMVVPGYPSIHNVPRRNDVYP